MILRFLPAPPSLFEAEKQLSAPDCCVWGVWRVCRRGEDGQKTVNLRSFDWSEITENRQFRPPWKNHFRQTACSVDSTPA
jgi:hypothetical protein